MMPSAKRTPTKIDGSAPGKITRRKQLAIGHAVDAAHLDQLRIRGADAVQRVEIDREEHPERHQNSLADSSIPNHRMTQRNQRQMRNVAHHLQRRIGELAGNCDRPLARPKATDAAADQKAVPARQKLTQILRTSSPESSSFHPPARHRSAPATPATARSR